MTSAPKARVTPEAPQSPRAQLASFISRYSPAVAADGRAALAAMRRIVPGAVELVYDNYQWLVVGFCPSERPSDAVFSIVFTPRWITLCFLQSGPKLSDPHGLLRGSGTRVRHIRLASAKDLASRPIRALMREALSLARVPFPRRRRGSIVIRAISAKRRPRRP